MKKSIVLLFACVFLLEGCNQIEPIVQEEEGCLVSFNLMGEITTDETPMTKASTGDIYLIQVYKNDDPFASGFYDDPERINVFLKKSNQKYRIIISVIKGGIARLKSISKWNSEKNMLRVFEYYRTYVGEEDNGTFSYAYGSYEPWFTINRMFYNSVRYYDEVFYNNDGYLYNNIDCLKWYLKYLTTANLFGDKYPRCDDWFYGEINNYSPTGSYETLPLDLKRVGFKIKYELSGVTDGEVTVKVYNDTKTFINKTTTASTYSSGTWTYAFYDVHSAWQYADDYTENMTLAVSWLRGIGVTEDYGTKTIQIKRNCLNNIKISLGNNDQNAGMTMTVESESTIGAEDVTIPVQ